MLIGGRKGVAIELAAGRERQRVEHNERGGDHVVRQSARQMLAQHRGVRGMTGGGNDIAHEALVASMVFASDNRGLGDAIMLTEHGFDLAGLDAEAADLELMVGTAEKMQRALGSPPRTVAGAVHAAAWRSERIGDETFGGQARAVEVAARQTAAGDIEFARHSDRHRLQAIVQDIDPRVPDRTPDRRIGRAGERHAHGGADRRFGWSIRVDHPTPFRPARDQIGRTGIAANDQGAELLEPPARHAGENRRRNKRMADCVPRQRIGKDLAGNEAGLRDDQRGSSRERHEQFHDRSVETGRGELQDARIGSDAEPLDLGSGEARDADM